MVELTDRVALAIRSQHLIGPGDRVLVGVSGGADSVCLLDCLHRLNLPLVVAHFDHRLRASSWSDARAVLRFAAARGLPAIVERAGSDLSHGAAGSLEERARQARYAFLARAARQCDCAVVAVGHTAEDQAETVLMHLLRGAGVSGLRGMLPVTAMSDCTGAAEDEGLRLVRPLLDVSRQETHAYCARARLPVCRDQTNDDVTFFRNRLRKELLPILRTYNPEIREVLCRTAKVMAGEKEALDAATQPAWRSLKAERSEGIVAFDLPRFRGLSTGLQRAVLREAVSSLLPGLRDLSFDALEGARELEGNGSRASLPGGLEVVLEGDRLLVAKADRRQDLSRFPQVAIEDPVSITIPGVIDLAHEWRFRSEIIAGGGSLPARSDIWDDPWAAEFDAAAISGPLMLRRHRRGDRLQPFGLQGHTKLSDLFINSRVPVRARKDWPVVCQDELVLWVPGLRRAEGARVTSQTQRRIVMRVAAPATRGSPDRQVATTPLDASGLTSE